MRHTEVFWKPWQAADYLRIPVEAVYKLIDRGEIVAERRDGTWYLRKTGLDEWLDRPATTEELEELQRLINSTAHPAHFPSSEEGCP